jgi:two-component system, OmpR family, sensor kinase
MRRVPIRLRLALAFALAMGVVFAATGAFLYVELRASLDESIDESLDARMAELAPRVAEGDGDIGAEQIDSDEQFAQVLDLMGRVLGGTAQIGEDALLPDADALGRLSQGSTLRFALEDVPGVSGPTRILAMPVETPSGRRVLLVGTSLEDRNETLREFLIVLLLVGPAALLLTALLGYGLATAALRPVEAMRAEAAAISGSEPGRHLPLPHSRDEIHRLGETLNEMLDRLEAAIERERGFVADASHELRTPLALLKAELELALRRPRSAPELEEAIRSAAEETDRLTGLADDLLLLARSDRGELTIRPARIRAADLLGRVADRFRRHADAADRSIEVDRLTGLELEADPRRLEQAVGNLVENALKHGDGSVCLSALENDGEVELHVRDEGHGFAPAFLPRAFDRFTRADDARSGDGTGLGLTIAAAIARAHGGSVHAENLEGGGAGVWLTLPKS